METLVEAMNRLRAAGYAAEFGATSDGRLRCEACGTEHEPDDLVIDETVRFEGASDPGDESILVALTCECGVRGLFSAAFGPDTPPEEAKVLRALASAGS